MHVSYAVLFIPSTSDEGSLGMIFQGFQPIAALSDVRAETNRDRNLSYVLCRSSSAWQCLTECKDAAYSRVDNERQHNVLGKWECPVHFIQIVVVRSIYI